MRKILCFINNLQKCTKKTDYFFIPFIFAAVLFASQPAAPGEPAAFLVREGGFSLSIETYKERDGWTPLVLSSAALEFRLWMNRRGEVKELRRDSLPAVFTIDLDAGQLLLYGQVLPFEIYEHNGVRIRLRLLERGRPLRFSVGRRGQRTRPLGERRQV